MKHNIKTSILTIIITIISCLSPDSVSADSKSDIHNSVYCWYDHGIPTDSLEKTIDICHYLNISDVYTTFTNFDDQVEMISSLKANGISTYYLTGRSNWYNNVDMIIEKIDKVAEYNISHPDATITGIVLDIEPYTLKEYKADEITGFSTYADTIENAYTYAQSKNIRFVNAIPYWYDNYMIKDKYSDKDRETAKKAFDKIFQNADRISVMNYLRRNMTEHMKNEIIYASLYNIEIESTADLSKTSGTSTNDETSFYAERNPISSINDSWKDMYQTYGYDKLNFSYHHMHILLEINIYKEKKPDYIKSERPISKANISSEYGSVINNGKGLYMITKGKEAAFVGTSDVTIRKITIPDKISYKNSYISVTSISAGAFKDMSITTLKIGKNVKSIGASAFENCKKLKRITITGKKLKNIGKNSFKNINKNACFKLKGNKNAKKIMRKRIKKKKIGYRKTWNIKG